MEMELRVGLRKGGRSTGRVASPRTAPQIFTVGNARPLDQALQHATTEMLTGWRPTTATT